ncbi:helix-turn-helix domain-containing protein [Humibacter antri]
MNGGAAVNGDGAAEHVAGSTEPAARRRVLDVLAGSRHPLDAKAVADKLGVHVTTARFHLDQLEAAGLVQRRTARENRPGRPRLVYVLSATLRAADAREQLIEVLANALGGPLAADTQPRRRGRAAAVAAGERWADAVERRASAPEAETRARAAANSSTAHTAEVHDPVEDLVDVLDSLGFAPEAVGDEILMHECPFRAAARERPDVVCAVHQGLVERMLASVPADGRLKSRRTVGSGPVAVPRTATLLPFVQPDLCVVQLGRSA